MGFWEAVWHLAGKAWFAMVAATSQSTLGLFIWTVGLAIAGWLARRYKQFSSSRKAHSSKKEDLKRAFEGGLSDAFVELLAIFAIGFLSWMGFIPVVIYRDHSQLVKSNGKQQTLLSSCQGEVKQLMSENENFRQNQPLPFVESSHSLRRRTIKLVDDLSEFWARKGRFPAPLMGATPEERNQRNKDWENKVRQDFMEAGFRERIVGIIDEYKSKGIKVDKVQQSVDLLPETLFGEYSWEEECTPFSQGVICQIRELAYHVDQNDNIIVWSKSGAN